MWLLNQFLKSFQQIRPELSVLRGLTLEFSDYLFLKNGNNMRFQIFARNHKILKTVKALQAELLGLYIR